MNLKGARLIINHDDSFLRIPIDLDVALHIAVGDEITFGDDLNKLTYVQCTQDELEIITNYDFQIIERHFFEDFLEIILK